MPHCAAKYCRNNSRNSRNRGIKYHCFPNDITLAKKWMEVCSISNPNLKDGRICSVHFTPNCYVKKPHHLIVPGDKNIWKLSKTAIPTKFLTDESKTKSTTNNTDYGCLQKVKIENSPDLKQHEESIEYLHSLQKDCNATTSHVPNKTTITVKQEVIDVQVHCELLRNENENLKKDNAKLREKKSQLDCKIRNLKSALKNRKQDFKKRWSPEDIVIVTPFMR